MYIRKERKWSEQSIESTGANGTARSQTALKSETCTSTESGKGRGRECPAAKYATRRRL